MIIDQRLARVVGAHLAETRDIEAVRTTLAVLAYQLLDPQAERRLAALFATHPTTRSADDGE